MKSSLKRGRKPIYTHIINLDGVNAKQIYSKLKSESSSVFKSDVFTFEPKINDSSILIFGDSPHKHEVSNLETRNDYLQDTIDKTVIMKDHVDYGCLPNRTDLHCWHDKHTFNTSPIGIPIKYVSKTLYKKPGDETNSGMNDYFLTKGIFCSFPCCLAYIKEHGSQEFRNSEPLLNCLYSKLYNKELNTRPAPDWRNLKVFGGTLSIDEFRKNFSNYTYIITDNIKRPYMVAVGNWVENLRSGLI